MKKYTNFDEYIRAQLPEAKAMLLDLRDIIRHTLPDATESMSYGVPCFNLVKDASLDQRIMIAGFKKHVSLYPHPDTIEAFAEKLKGYTVKTGTIQFRFQDALPVTLIQEIVLYRWKAINEQT